MRVTVSAEAGEVGFETLWEVRDEQDGDKYFLDVRCVGVHKAKSEHLVDIDLLVDGKKESTARYV